MEKKVEKGLTTRALAIGIVYTLFVSVSMTYMECFHTYGLPWAGSVVGQYVDPSWNVAPWFWTIMYTFILLGIISLLPGKYRLNRQEITVIMVMTMLSVPMVMPQNHIVGVPWYAPLWFGLIPKLWGAPYDTTMKYFVPWMTPSITNQWQWPTGFNGRPNGVTPAPFDMTMQALGSTFWWLGQWISLMFLMVFVAALLRRLWIEKESLPFPNVALGMELVDKFAKGTEGAAKSKLAKISQEKWLLLGILIAQIMLMPGWLWKIYDSMKLPTTAFAVTKTVHTGVAGDWMNLIIPVIPIALCWTSPFGLGLSLTMPFDLLVSFIIVWIVAIVIGVNVEVSMGIISALPANAKLSDYVNKAIMNFIPGTTIGQTGGGGWAMVAFGVVIASAIYPLVTATGREYVKEVFRLIRSPSAEAEKGEALSYRWLACGAVAFFLIYLAFYAPTPAAPALWYIAIVQFVNVLIWVGGARYVAETGAWGGYWCDGGYIMNQFSGYSIGMVRDGLGAVIGRSVTDSSKNGPIAYACVACSGSAFQERTIVAQTTPWMMEGFTLASLTGTRIRNLLIAAVVAIIVTWIGGSAMYLYYQYRHNWFGVYYQYFESDFSANGALSTARGLQGPYDFWSYGWWGEPNVTLILSIWALGAAIAFASYALRARYPKFIFHPMAILLWFMYRHGSFMALPGAMFLSVIIALTVKYVTTRYYGAPFYDQKIKPLALGLILGTVIFFIITFMMDQAFVVQWFW